MKRNKQAEFNTAFDRKSLIEKEIEMINEI